MVFWIVNSATRKDAMSDGIIRLGQFLKLAGLVATGGEAKYLIQEGQVRVNGQIEKRRKRQLALGDKVTLNGHIVIVEEDEGESLPDPDGERV
jgi:ribosome-associated protein